MDSKSPNKKSRIFDLLPSGWMQSGRTNEKQLLDALNAALESGREYSGPT